LAAGWWLLARNKTPRARLASDHILVTTLIESALPHLLKKVFDQERPDRRTVSGHWRGIPFSGKRLDAFPAGHAVHIGALASTATLLPAMQRNAAWAVGLGQVLRGQFRRRGVVKFVDVGHNATPTRVCATSTRRPLCADIVEKSKIERHQKSSENRFVVASNAAVFSADTKVGGRFCVKRCDPSGRRVRNAPAVLKISFIALKRHFQH
jgi:hypothetical protein